MFKAIYDSMEDRKIINYIVYHTKILILDGLCVKHFVAHFILIARNKHVQ